ncbi:hypothetical protein [Kitasatospora purpeofusca]|uniref:Uncharacterized protein n=1 Tax=Kitasatospora purpeofusca TaxID=67352 RepID=A0ABZ1U9N7_9ACTN|nr:hypothetical protein [Kitasatospora purpeofusca]
MRVDHPEQDTTVIDFTSRLLGGLVRTGNTAEVHADPALYAALTQEAD